MQAAQARLERRQALSTQRNMQTPFTAHVLANNNKKGRNIARSPLRPSKQASVQQSHEDPHHYSAAIGAREQTERLHVLLVRVQCGLCVDAILLKLNERVKIKAFLVDLGF